MHPVRPATGPTHFEPQSEDYLDELIEEDQRRVRRRRLTWLDRHHRCVVVAIVLAALLGYQWTQSRYFVGASAAGKVAIYQGVQQNLGPDLPLARLRGVDRLRVDALPGYDRQLVEQTINAGSLAAAHTIVDQLNDAVDK